MKLKTIKRSYFKGQDLPKDAQFVSFDRDGFWMHHRFCPDRLADFLSETSDSVNQEVKPWCRDWRKSLRVLV